MNSHVVRLLQDKLLPLHRARYEHLQKINKALHKDKLRLLTHPSTRLQLPQTTHIHMDKRSATTRSPVLTNAALTADMLLNRLHSLKHPRPANDSDWNSQGWDSLFDKIADSKVTSVADLTSRQHGDEGRSRTNRRREPFF